MFEIIKFIFGDFWVWLGFTITVGIPTLYAIDCIKETTINACAIKAQKAERIAALKEWQEVNKK